MLLIYIFHIKSCMIAKVLGVKKSEWNNTIATAVRVLKNGGVIVYPTETSYGLGCDATSRKAVKMVYRIKRRISKKPLSVIFGSIASAKRYVQLNNIGSMLVKRFMPGPLTLVAKSKKKLVGSPKNEIAFRIPSGRFALTIARKFKKPITATSANLSGKEQIYDSDKLDTFKNKVSLIIDAGNLPKRKISTIFDLRTMKIIRKGAITKKKIAKFLK